MSTEPVTTFSSSIDLDINTTDDAETILEALTDADGICRWCFGRRCHYSPSHPSAGLPDRDVDPSASHETVPARTDERGDVVDPARPHVVCECGVVDVDPTDDRTVDELLEAVVNLSDRLAEAGLAHSSGAAQILVDKYREAGEAGGNDDEILENAIRLGREWADDLD
ncbi:hypothetical protein [Natronorubrum sp. FCH18a]|uniref:hypothetical protein n=1 Tax=Natronorubrum sp. FCH18a TaxID=3447018 RepID=UPI003F5152E8